MRPGGFELPTFWFVANGVKMLNALFGVAYELETPFFPQLAAPNLAPKTEQHRNRTVLLIGSIVKPRSGWPKKSFEPPISKFRTMNTKGRNNNSPETGVVGLQISEV